MEPIHNFPHGVESEPDNANPAQVLLSEILAAGKETELEQSGVKAILEHPKFIELAETGYREGTLQQEQVLLFLDEFDLGPEQVDVILRLLAEIEVDVQAAVMDTEEVAEAKSPRSEDNSFSTDNLQIFLKDVGKYPLLSPFEEVVLAKKIELVKPVQWILSREVPGDNPDDKYDEKDLRLYEELLQRQDLTYVQLAQIENDGLEAKRLMNQANLRLVVSIAKRYRKQGLPFLDLIQEGTVGLARGVEKFDWRKGFKFSTYATWWIRQGIARAIADKARTIRMPVHQVERHKRLLMKQGLKSKKLKSCAECPNPLFLWKRLWTPMENRFLVIL
jgi:RNA polymerase primary sigma factor